MPSEKRRNGAIMMCGDFAEAHGRKLDGAAWGSWKWGVLDIYRRMKARDEQYSVAVDGIDVIVLPGVYSPGFFTDSIWFSRVLPRLVGKHSLLEIGCGTGIIALQCARNGAQVVATDINPMAVRNTEMNVRKCKLDVKVREGDVYEAVGADERFEFVFWAHPFNNSEVPVEDMLLRSGFDYGYQGLMKYLRGGTAHLAEGGGCSWAPEIQPTFGQLRTWRRRADTRFRCWMRLKWLLEEGQAARIRYFLVEFVQRCAGTVEAGCGEIGGLK